LKPSGARGPYGILGLLLASGAAFHFTVLSKLGINGWTGEPRERFDALLREIALRGEVATLFRSLVARERGGKPETHTPTASATAPDVLTPTDRS
jgi:hypothetical protein